jgi:hypothetical protein
MNINQNKLETSLETVQKALKNQDLPSFMKKRWARALEKAKERLIEQPYFSWQPDRLLIVSVPQEKTDEFGCRFYEANEEKCRRVDKSGFCQAFFEGFPCWHRAAFLLLKICFGEDGENGSDKNRNHAVSAKSVNQS